MADRNSVAAAISTTCRRVLIDSPVASRYALERFRTLIDPELANKMEIVGSYTCKDGSTPLHESANQGDAPTTQYLIAAGAGVSARDTNSATPVDLAVPGCACHDLLKHHACILRQVDADPAALVSAAVAHCAILSSSSKESVPAPALTLRAYQLDPSFLWAPPTARFKIFAWARNTSIYQLAATTQPCSQLPDDCAGDIMDYLTTTMPRTETLHILTHCSSPEAQDWVRAGIAAAVTSEATAKLGPAVAEDDVALVQDCLMKGASVEVQTKFGHTALIEAASSDANYAIVKLLLEAGANMEAKDEEGATALLHTSLDGEVAVVKLLLEAGANIEAENNDGYTPLVAATFWGSTATVKLLFEAGANIEARDKDGKSALMHASALAHSDTVEFLLQAGADTEAKDKNGLTALITVAAYWFCEEIGHPLIVKLLLEAGANKEAKDINGRTVLDRAREDDYPDLVDLLE